MTSCAGESDYHFNDSADAKKQYRDFHSIAEEHQANAEKLSDFICRWQELSDTVYNYIKKDPAFNDWSTLPENLVNKLGYLPNTFCTHNVQNVSKKKARQVAVHQVLASYLTNFQHLSFILRQRSARRLMETDYQYITEIWETSGKNYEHELHILHPIFSISNMLFILCH